jgi:hypothetical protein
LTAEEEEADNATEVAVEGLPATEESEESQIPPPTNLPNEAIHQGYVGISTRLCCYIHRLAAGCLNFDVQFGFYYIGACLVSAQSAILNYHPASRILADYLPKVT